MMRLKDKRCDEMTKDEIMGKSNGMEVAERWDWDGMGWG
jgi:hypothetical protein